jgi:hypothetical protein
MSETAERVASNVVTGENRAEFMAKRLGLVTPDPKPEPKEEPPEDAKEPVQAELVEEEEEKKPKRPDINDRFKKLGAEKRQAEEARQAAEAKARELEAKIKEYEEKGKPQKIDPEIGPKPNPADYTDNQKYWEDLAEWKARETITTEKREQAKNDRERALKETIRAHAERVKAISDEIPDYHDVLSSASDLSVNDLIRDTILDSDQSARILYHLASHRDEVAELNEMSPQRALKYLGRLEAKLEKTEPKAETKPETKAEKPRTRPPEPITPIRASSVAADDKLDASGEFTGSYADWKALRKAGKLGR